MSSAGGSSQNIQPYVELRALKGTNDAVRGSALREELLVEGTELLYKRAKAQMLEGNFPSAAATTLKALQIFEEIGAHHRQAQAFHWLYSIYGHMGNETAAGNVVEASAALAHLLECEAADCIELVAGLLNNHARLDEAIEMYRRAVELFSRLAEKERGQERLIEFKTRLASSYNGLGSACHRALQGHGDVKWFELAEHAYTSAKSINESIGRLEMAHKNQENLDSLRADRDRISGK